MFVPGVRIVAIAIASSIISTSYGELVDTFEVGTGEFTSEVLFQFENENQYLYKVQYSGTMTGRDLFDVMIDAQPDFFDATIDSYSFGDFLVDLTIGDDYNGGYGSPPDYLDSWQYWTSDGPFDDWASSMVGFSDRIVQDGSRDAWVFNSANAPIPAAPVGFFMLGTVALRRRRH